MSCGPGLRGAVDPAARGAVGAPAPQYMWRTPAGWHRKPAPLIPCLRPGLVIAEVRLSVELGKEDGNQRVRNGRYTVVFYQASLSRVSSGARTVHQHVVPRLVWRRLGLVLQIPRIRCLAERVMVDYDSTISVTLVTDQLPRSELGGCVSGAYHIRGWRLVRTGARERDSHPAQ